MDDQERKEVKQDIAIENQFLSGANWFFWIAVLSLINSAIMLTGSEWGFVIGLGMTQLIDGICLGIAEHMGNAAKVIAFVLDILAAGIFVLFGFLARKKLRWAFIVGMVFYALDGLIFLLVKDFLSIGFHVFALFCIFKGFQACGRLNRLAPVQETIEGYEYQNLE